ncbi:MAG: hypothetical protein MPL62_05700 [Alphaproteobacteria bacterium]|nr:hypothetical protein [Alphaproteobacteria bacterium]
MAERVRSAPRAFYIRLGTGSHLASRCVKGGYMAIGFPEVSHNTLKRLYTEGKTPGVQKAILGELRSEHKGARNQTLSGYTNQLIKFYTESDAIWITFWDMRLWWTLPEGQARAGGELKKIPATWRYRALKTGAPFFECNVGGCVTKTAGFKGTLCGVGNSAEKGYPLRYLKCLILGERDETIALRSAPRAARKESVGVLLSRLNPEQMEWFVDKLFQKEGWKRISPLGGPQTITDFIAKKGESLALVQVKAETGQGACDGFRKNLERLLEDGKRGEYTPFFVYHTAGQRIRSDQNKVVVWGRDEMAQKVVSDRSGALYKWLREQVG